LRSSSMRLSICAFSPVQKRERAWGVSELLSVLGSVR
jgi:hypothetical protein